MEGKVIIVHDSKNPTKGGVQRYTYNLLKNIGKKLNIKTIDLSKINRNSLLKKLYFYFFWERKILEREIKAPPKTIHFTEEILFVNFKNIEKTKKIVSISSLFPYYENKGEWYKITLLDKLRNYLITRKLRECVKYADLLIANSEKTRRELIEFGANPKKIVVVSRGVEKKFKKDRTVKKRNIVGFIGASNRIKRPKKLVEDWARNHKLLKNYSLEVNSFGGDEIDFVRKFDGKYNIKINTGVKNKNLVKKYNSFSAFFFPSIYESFGQPILEASACEVPVFIYKDGKFTPETKKYCYSVESVREVPKILAKIDKKTLRKNANEIKKKFDWKKIVYETVGFYR